MATLSHMQNEVYRERAWRLSEAHPLTATALVMQNEFLAPVHDRLQAADDSGWLRHAAAK